jgi:hypothetical protein
MPQPIKGNESINAYRSLSEAVAIRLSREDMVGGNGGKVVNFLFINRIIASRRIMIPSGRWIPTSVW